LIALDQDEKRLKRVSENLERLALNEKYVDIITADAVNGHHLNLQIVSFSMHPVLPLG
jgi:16S rRNA C967 or C1407 C5-methylase (RsmB/RsmF family)